MFKVSDFEREICGDFQLGFEYDEKDNLSITSFTFNIVLWDEK